MQNEPRPQTSGTPTKTWIKRIAIGVAVLIALIVAGLAVFLLTFDPNAYKDRLQAWVQQRFHRTLTIEGDIEASLFPRLGLTLQGVTLSERDSTETFASVEDARMGVALWPLLSSKVEVDHATFSGVKARVIRDKQGRLNFQDLLQGRPASAADAAPPRGKPQPGKEKPATEIDIAGLDINDGEVLLRDDANGRALTISRLGAKTGRIRAANPFDVSLSAHVEGQDPAVNADVSGQATVRFDSQPQRYEVAKLDLDVTGRLPKARADKLSARGNLSYDVDSKSIDASSLELVFQGDLEGVQPASMNIDASVALQRLRFDPSAAALQLEKLAVRAKGRAVQGPFEFAADAPALDVSRTAASGTALTARLRMTGSEAMDVRVGIDGMGGNGLALSAAQVKLAADLRRGQRTVTLSAASPGAVDMQNRAISLSSLAGQVSIADPSLPQGKLDIPYAGNLQADLSRNVAQGRLDAQLEGGKLMLSANVTQLRSKPAVRFELSADALDLDKLVLPKASSGPAAPPLNGGAGKAAPAPATPSPTAPSSRSTTAPSTTAGTAPQSPAQSRPAGGSPAVGDANVIDLRALVGPSVQGTIKAGRLVAHGITATDVSAAANLAGGKLALTRVGATLYGGKLSGQASIDAAHDNAVATRFTLDNVAIGPLLADAAKQTALTGTGSISADLQSHGATRQAMVDRLGGVLQLRVRDGAIKGIDVARTLRELKQAILGSGRSRQAEVAADATRETSFTRLDADLALADGVATIKRLDVVSPVLRLGQGTPALIDLSKGTVDVVANVRIADPPPANVDLGELAGLAVPVHVAGPYTALRYRVDWRAVAGDALARTLQRALRKRGGDSENNGGSGRDRVEDLGRLLKGITGK